MHSSSFKDRHFVCSCAKDSLKLNTINICLVRLSAANKTWSQSITANLRPLTTHIYHVMIIVTGDFSKKSLLLLLLFPRNSFERS